MPADRSHSTRSELFFKPIIDSYFQNPRFIRRDWLAEQVQHAMEQENCRFVLLTAEPGAGKSTFMAQLAHDHPGDWLVYFIRRDQRELLGDVGAKSFLLRIGYQLASIHPSLFSEEQVKISVRQRIGITEASSEVIGIDVDKILASPFYQKVIKIQQDIENHAGRLIGLRVRELVVDERLLDLNDLQYLALIDPASALLRQDPKQRIIILVDALDEIRYHTAQQHILSWLIGCPELPANIRFVLTSRPPDQTLDLFSEEKKRFLQPLILKADDKHLQSDLNEYMTKLISNPSLREELAKTNQGGTDFASRAVEKADGNLGYLDILARAIDQALSRGDHTALDALRDVLSLRDLPAEMEDLYAFFFHKIKVRVSQEQVEVEDSENGKTRKEYVWPAIYRRMLGVLAVASEPLTLTQIKSLGYIRASFQDLSEALDHLRQFLDIMDNKIRLYHATLAEFLTDPMTGENLRTADLYVDSKKVHKQIGDYYWEHYQADWSGFDDYGLKNLATHLYRAELFHRLEQLINPKWMVVRYEKDEQKYEGFLSDLALAQQHARQEIMRQNKGQDRLRVIPIFIQHELIRQRIMSAYRLPDLISDAVTTGMWTPERALSTVARISDAKQCISTCLALLETKKLSMSQCTQAIQDGLRAVLKIAYTVDRIDALTALLPHLTAEQLQVVRDNLLRMKREQIRAIARDSLADEDNEFTVDIRRAEAFMFAGLAPYLTAEQLQEGLDAALKVVGYGPRALANLAPYLSKELLQHGLTFALQAQLRMKIRVSSDSTEKLKEITQTLQKSLDARLKVTNEQARAKVLFVLGPYLSGKQIQQALASARDIKDDEWRAKVLTVLASNQAGDDRMTLLQEGLDAACRISNKRLRAKALMALVPYLSGEQSQQALAAARNLEDDEGRVKVLTVLASNQAGEERMTLLQEGLDAALRIRTERSRAEALTALVPYLSGKQIQQVLVAAREIEDHGRRSNVFVTLVSHQLGENKMAVLLEGLDLVWRESTERSLAEALMAAFPELVEEKRPSILREWTLPFLQGL